MGQGISAPKDKCVSIQHIDELMNSSFTVKRTSGEMECGHFVPKDWHQCAGACQDHAKAAAWKSPRKDTNAYDWRIFMRNGEEDPNVHSCGWRRLTTIEPTNLSENQDAIDAWRNRITVLLEVEEAKRLAVASTAT